MKDLCVCLCAWPCPLHVCAFQHVAHICVFFYARVGVWMSVCMSLCCHICCYQGNPVGRRRSAERCTAWRRETCGAQPVAGKKPVRDSPTNPVPPSLPASARWALPRSKRRLQADSSTEGDEGRRSSRCCFLQPSRGFAFFPNTKSKYNWWIKNKQQQQKICKKKELLCRFGDFF